MRPKFLKSRNESLRLDGVRLIATIFLFAVSGVVAAAGIVALIIAADAGYAGLMVLALMFVLAAVMVHRGLK